MYCYLFKGYKLVPYFLVFVILIFSSPVCGEQGHQFCQRCHSTHYADRGNCTYCHRGNSNSGRKNIAHAGLISGKYARYTIGDKLYLNKVNNLIDHYSCRRCHVIDGRGNRLARSLDNAASQKSSKELAESIRQPVDIMPNFCVDDERATLLVNAILAGSDAHKVSTEAPFSVHFSSEKKINKDVFTRICGSCHRLLSERHGALGAGNIGPNLSGLFTTYYPKTFNSYNDWTFNNLKSWLKNPREVKPWARMMPIRITDDDLVELESILRVIPGAK